MAEQDSLYSFDGEPTIFTFAERSLRPDSSLKTPFRLHWWNTDKTYANASLASSRILLQRASKWSSNVTREGPHIMRFGRWRGCLCPVEHWYRTQVKSSQRTGPTTRFSVMQHRRTLEPPFFHEFLLIPLADGSFYRLERTGVGSNVDAISEAGCTACDIIEWFPGDKYKAYTEDKPSDLIAEVRFSSDFDILDVLAVCYSIQQQPRARKYTLQCYNCYFFCCTILAVLTRRLVDWERIEFSNTWDKLLEQVFNKVSALSSSPITERAKKYSILRVCSVRDPQNPSPGQVVIHALRGALQTASTAPGAFKEALDDTIWVHRFNASLAAYLTPRIRQGSMRLCRQLLEINSAEAKSRKPNDQKLVERIYERKKAIAVLNNWADIRKCASPLASRDHRVSLGAHLVAGLCGPLMGLGMGLAFNFSQLGLHGSDRLKFSFKYAWAGLRVGPSIMMGKLATREFAQEFRKRARINGHKANNDFINAVFDAFENDEHLDNEVSTGVIQLLAQREADWNGLRYSIETLLFDNMEELVEDKLYHGDVTTWVRQAHRPLEKADQAPVDGEPASKKVNIFDFQCYIRQHIKAYADRVERHGLDSSMLVCHEVEKAMSEVWRSMPEGFGAKIYRSSESS
ncbi:hypothetical protein FS749_001627 [Ceratobasidium sp. UAMH 11750]|nr:hypothetical protein FS749_001627 [Ceratobasidium sp. UAMH 11750]